MDRKLMKQIDQEIEAITEQGLQKSNIEILGQLIDMKKDICMTEEYEKGGKEMNYREGYGEYSEGGYGRRGNYREGGYSEEGYSEGNYGRRGVKGTGRGRRRYKGDDMLDDMYGAYGEYEEGREEYERGNYGADSKKSESLKYMLESVVDFFKMLKKDASSQEDMEMIKHYAKKISEM